MEKNNYALTEEETYQFFTIYASKPAYIETHKFSAHHKDTLKSQ